jgi:hypothetical protein
MVASTVGPLRKLPVAVLPHGRVVQSAGMEANDVVGRAGGKRDRQYQRVNLLRATCWIPYRVCNSPTVILGQRRRECLVCVQALPK